MTLSISHLGDCHLPDPRCLTCLRVLPSSSPAEGFKTQGGFWVVVLCAHCKRWSPFQLRTQ